ncbi:MAG: hypothetical protein QXE27_08110 [Thermoplasmata archaeon]
MNKVLVVWFFLWIFASIGVFLLCVMLKSTMLAGIFLFAGFIIAAIAQLAFGTASWGFTGRGPAVRPMPYVTRFSTFMKGIARDRYMLESQYEWNIGFGLTLFGILMFVGGLLASAYLRVY